MNPKESNNDLPQEFFLQQQQMAIFDINNTNFGYNPDYAVYNVKVNALTTITCTLPDITDMEGAVFYIKFDPTSGLTGTINIVPFTTGQTIEGSNSKTITFLTAGIGEAVQICAHGTNWMILSGLL